MDNKTFVEYVESFGWRVEDLTEQELKEVEKEMEDISNGMVILDSILFKKPFSSPNK